MAAPDPSSLPSLVARIERAVGSDCTAIAAHPQALVLAGATRWRILEALLTWYALRLTVVVITRVI